MKTVLRAVVTLAASVSIALAGAASVHAASPSPDLIGGALDAKPDAVTLTSKSTVAVAVVMATEGPFTLTPSAFNIDPGETVTMAVTGEAKGRLSASMVVLSPNLNGETSSVTLEVGFPQPAPWSPPWLAIALGLAGIFIVARGLVALRRLSRRYTITRKD